ncbi:hypothetical protein ES702_01464 [subsurface metagenome]
MLSNSKVKNIRHFLLMFAFIIAYISAFTMGAITAIHNPTLKHYTDYSIFILSAFGILFIAVFYGLYERNVNITLNARTLEIVSRYGEGESFQKIKDEMSLPNIATVKQELIKFCKLKK